MTRPFRQAAASYRRRGWQGVLPLPYRRKSSPPSGFTGYGAPYPSDDQVAQWIKSNGNGNIGLRLPENVVALDVDSYDGKPGDRTLADREETWGRLPPTCRIVNRTDSRVGGHFLFRLPDDALGLKWHGLPGIDILRHEHRYCVAPPSVHPSGRVYRWWIPRALPPYVEDLPLLPDAWIGGMTNGEAAAALPRAAGVAVAGWLAAHGRG